MYVYFAKRKTEFKENILSGKINETMLECKNSFQLKFIGYVSCFSMKFIKALIGVIIMEMTIRWVVAVDVP